MPDQRSARMRGADRERCVTSAAGARTPEEVARIRADLLRRWPGDLRARDLAEALCLHQMLLAAGDSRTADPRHLAGGPPGDDGPMTPR
jgi:hypothetical protein